MEDEKEELKGCIRTFLRFQEVVFTDRVHCLICKKKANLRYYHFLQNITVDTMFSIRGFHGKHLQ